MFSFVQTDYMNSLTFGLLKIRSAIYQSQLNFYHCKKVVMLELSIIVNIL